MAAYCNTISLIILILAILLQTVAPLKCYSCTSKNPAEKCQDHFDSKAHTADVCDLTTSVCLKQKLAAVGKFPESTHRGCVEEEYCKNYGNTSKHCSICNKDFCNSSRKISATVTYLSLFLSTSYFYKKLMFS